MELAYALHVCVMSNITRGVAGPQAAREKTQGLSDPNQEAERLGTLCSCSKHTNDTSWGRKHPNRAVIADNIWKGVVEREPRGSTTQLTFGSIIFR